VFWGGAGGGEAADVTEILGVVGPFQSLSSHRASRKDSQDRRC
jgi:hypothetical protein